MGRAPTLSAPARPHRWFRRGGLGRPQTRRANERERGAAMVEFAIVVPLLILLVCGTIDFGLIFGGYQSMENGVASAARVISLDQVTPTASCTQGGVQTPTANAVCNVAASLGNLEGLNSNTLSIGICFVAPAPTASCSGPSGPGSSVANDVEICAQATMMST